MPKEKSATVPSERQRAVLDACKGGRVVTLTGTTRDGKTTVKAAVETPKGRPVAGLKVDRLAVEGCVKHNWLASLQGEVTPANGEVPLAGGEGDSPPAGDRISRVVYGITEEGKKARKVRPASG